MCVVATARLALMISYDFELLILFGIILDIEFLPILSDKNIVDDGDVVSIFSVDFKFFFFALELFSFIKFCAVEAVTFFIELLFSIVVLLLPVEAFKL